MKRKKVLGWVLFGSGIAIFLANFNALLPEIAAKSTPMWYIITALAFWPGICMFFGWRLSHPRKGS